MRPPLDPPLVPDREVPSRIDRAPERAVPRRRLLEHVAWCTPTRDFAIELIRLSDDASVDVASHDAHTVILVAEGHVRAGDSILERFDLVLAPPGVVTRVEGRASSSSVLVIRTGVNERARPGQSFSGGVRFREQQPMRTRAVHRLVPDAFRDVLSPRDLYLLVGPTNGRAGVTYGASGPDLFQLALAGTPRGNGPALHVHTASDEIFVVLEGRYAIRWGDEGEHEAILGPFDAIALPTGTNRTFTNVGDGYGYILPIVLGVSDELEDIVWLPNIERELRARLSPALLMAARLVGLSFRPRA